MFVIKNEYQGACVTRTIRFTEKLFDRLQEAAQRNQISFNKLVLQCCQYAMDHEK